jgi:adenosylcobinamide-GDP ribazoletransferase
MTLIGALGLFSVVPLGSGREFTRTGAVAALRWFPAVGGLLGAAAALPTTAVLQWAPHAALLGAVLGIGVLAILTRGLHLDGLADTVDGLGSRAPAERALEIMRRSDIGPFGVLAIVLAVLVDIAALTSLGEGVWRPVAALAVAAATGRVAALQAAHRRVPSARESGFGAYVAGSVSTPVAAAETVLVLGFGVLLAWTVDASLVGWGVAQAAALVLAAGFRMHTTRRLGGVTGDVFGALVEIGTALTLAGLAFS